MIKKDITPIIEIDFTNCGIFIYSFVTIQVVWINDYKPLILSTSTSLSTGLSKLVLSRVEAYEPKICAAHPSLRQAQGKLSSG